MIVTFIPHEGRKDHWDIVINGEKWREVHKTIFGAKPCFPSVSSEKEIQEVFDDYEYRRVKNYLFWLLSRQNYHSEQLGKMLQRRLVQEHTIHLVLQDFQTQGHLDDDAWLNAFVKTHQRKYGLPLILNKLRSKGLSSHTLSQIKRPTHSKDEEITAIHHLLETRYRLKDLTDRNTREKVFASLMRKGFSLENIKAAMNIICK